MSTPDNSATPLLLVGNKQDLPSALPQPRIESLLECGRLRQLWRSAPSCAVTGEGLVEALADLKELILVRRRMGKKHKKMLK